MNRKEFTNLLLEWRKNFINERGKYSSEFNSPDAAYLSSLRDETGKIIEDLLDHINKKKGTDFKRNAASGHTNVLSKNKQNIEIISNFIASRGYNKEAHELRSESNNESALVITYDSGTFLIDKPDSADIDQRAGGSPDVSWILHDLVHTLLEGHLVGNISFESDLIKQKIRKKMSKAYNYKVGSSVISDMMWDTDDDDDFLRTKKLIKSLEKLFSEIEFTSGVGDIDTAVSVSAYCWMKMDHENDLQAVDNCESLSNEEKKLVKEYFKETFPKVDILKDITLNALSNCIVISSL